MLALTIFGISLLIILFMYLRYDSHRKKATNYQQDIKVLKLQNAQLNQVNSFVVGQNIKLLQQRIASIDASPLLQSQISQTQQFINATQALIIDVTQNHRSVQEACIAYFKVNGNKNSREIKAFLSSQNDYALTLWQKNSLESYFNLCTFLVDNLVQQTEMSVIE